MLPQPGSLLPLPRYSHALRARALTGCLAVGALLSGCSTMPNGDRWGQDVGVPTWQRVGGAGLLGAAGSRRGRADR